MVAMVALLRGVNVGGRAKLAMAQLRDVVADCGYAHARTYIQSGNVVFSATGPTAAVARRLGEAISRATGLTPEVAVRTRRELASVIDRNPFLRRGDDPAHLHVVFLPSGTCATLGAFDPAAYAPDQAVAGGDEIFLSLPGGVGRSKLAADLARRSAAIGTMRNWRTVTKLLELLGELP